MHYSSMLSSYRGIMSAQSMLLHPNRSQLEKMQHRIQLNIPCLCCGPSCYSKCLQFPCWRRLSGGPACAVSSSHIRVTCPDRASQRRLDGHRGKVFVRKVQHRLDWYLWFGFNDLLLIYFITWYQPKVVIRNAISCQLTSQQAKETQMNLQSMDNSR